MFDLQVGSFYIVIGQAPDKCTLARVPLLFNLTTWHFYAENLTVSPWHEIYYESEFHLSQWLLIWLKGQIMSYYTISITCQWYSQLLWSFSLWKGRIYVNFTRSRLCSRVSCQMGQMQWKERFTGNIRNAGGKLQFDTLPWHESDIAELKAILQSFPTSMLNN